jgi:hypothetical protein
MQTSPTPERKLVSFKWLPLDRWTVDNLFELFIRDYTRRCKVCDADVKVPECEAHIKFHIEEEKARVARRKAEAEAKAEEEREWRKREAALVRENIRAVEGKPANNSKPRRINKSAKSKAEIVSALADYFQTNGEATLAVLTEALGIDKNIIRQQIGNVEGVVIVGQVKTGQRGRPAVIYGRAS